LESDGNASWDLLAAGTEGLRLYRTRPLPGSGSQLLASRTISSLPAEHVRAADLDNDGFQDAICWGSAGIRLYRGGPEGSFAPFDDSVGSFSEPVDALTCADVDHDGDLDLLVASGRSVRLLDNVGGNGNG
jgi:hypothetical protein